MTIPLGQNSYNNPVNGNPRAPAVAAMVTGDNVYFYRVGFFGVQDTLWDDWGRHYFRKCTIQGAVDFIFGNGQSIYEVKRDLWFLTSRLSFFARIWAHRMHRSRSLDNSWHCRQMCRIVRYRCLEKRSSRTLRVSSRRREGPTRTTRAASSSRAAECSGTAQPSWDGRGGATPGFCSTAATSRLSSDPRVGMLGDTPAMSTFFELFQVLYGHLPSLVYPLSMFKPIIHGQEPINIRRVRVLRPWSWQVGTG